MQPISNWENISATTMNDRMPAGGYVCVIKKCTDNPDRQCLTFEVDVVEGPWKNYAADTSERAGFWPLDFVKSYKPKAQGFFKAMIEAIAQTNSGFVWDWNEKKLIGKGVGIVFREEEYEGRDGKVKTRLKPFEFKTANEIRQGDFTVPERKAIDHVTASATFTELPDDEDDGTLPF